MFREFMKNYKLIICSILVIMVCICICGCTPSYYEDDAVGPIEEKARQILETYVQSFGEEAEITKIGMMTGAQEGSGIYSGYYLSHVCEGKIKAPGLDKEILVCVNIEDGSIWSNYDQHRQEFVDPDKVVKDQIKPYFEKYGYFDDYEIDDASIYYYVLSHDVETNKKNKTENTYVEFSNVIPVTEEAFSYANMDLSGFTVYYKPQNETYLNSHIVADYLDESGNYVKTDFEGLHPNMKYELISSGEGSYASYTLDTKKWVTTLELNYDDIKDMDCSVYRFDRMALDNKILLYCGANKSARIYRIDEKEFEESVPLEIKLDGNKLICDDSGAYIYFMQEPHYSKIIRTTFDHETGEPDEPFRMDITEIRGGLYSITDGLLANQNGYYIGKKQILEFIE